MIPERSEAAVNFMSENNLAMVTVKGTMKSLVAAIALGGVLSITPVAAAWAGMFDGPVFSAQNGGYGGGRGNHGAREARQPREARVAQPVPQPQPREHARGQMSDEERRQLHRDLDKANRELYRGRRQ